MKKAQVFDNLFFYLFIVVIVFFGVIIGIKYVANTVNTSKDIVTQEFFTNFNTKVQKAYLSNPGVRVSMEYVNVPSTIKEVCFIDFNKEINYSNVNNEEFKNYLINITKEDNKNFFVYGELKDSSFKSFLIENVAAKDLNPVCDTNKDGKTNFVALSTLKKAELTLEL